jgi:D-alanine-D-alanine ligase
VLVLYSLTPERCAPSRWAEEFDVTPSVDGVVKALPGSIAAGVRGEFREVVTLLEHHSPDVVFNLCEAPLGRPDREHHVAAVLEWMGVPFTGSRSETLALCRRKDRTKAVLAGAGVPVPREGCFPCVVKPAGEDGSYGVHDDSLCQTESEIARACARFRGPALIEEFLPGREFAVSLWGRDTPDDWASGETIFSAGMRLNTYAAKWRTESPDFANTEMRYDTEVSPDLRDAVLAAARGAWRAVEAHGYLRVDVREDAAGVPRVMDVNPNPALSPGIGVGRAAVEIGWTWEQLINRLVEWAF